MMPLGYRAPGSFTFPRKPNRPAAEAEPEPTDTIPDSFGFTPATGQLRSTSVASNVVTPQGFDAPTTISIVFGEYRINGGSWTSSAGTFNPGDTVQVRRTSAATYSTTVVLVLTIGGVAGGFGVTTMADPDAVAKNVPAFWPESGMLAYYPFDDGFDDITDTKTRDHSGNNRHLDFAVDLAGRITQLPVGSTSQGWHWIVGTGLKMRRGIWERGIPNVKTIACVYKVIASTSYLIAYENAVSGVRGQSGGAISGGSAWIGDENDVHTATIAELAETGVWKLLFFELTTAQGTPIALFGRVATAEASTSRVGHGELAWAGMWDRALTDQDRLDVYDALVNGILADRGIALG
jgi:hypothetical protein